MAHFFSLQDGNLLDTNVYGTSFAGAEITSNTTGTMLLTSSLLYSTSIINTNAETISALAFNLSARAANPTGTLGLTLQRTASAGAFLDSSSNNLTITTVGTAFQNTFSPFSPNGWSGYFIGATINGQYILCNYNAALNYGTGNFTIEAFIYSNIASNPQQYIIAQQSANNGVILTVDTNRLGFHDGRSGDGFIYSTASLSSNTWYHVAVTRWGTGTNQAGLFINGILNTTFTTSIDYTSFNNNIIIGNYQTGTVNRPFNGFISNLRINKGTALYTANFTPSSSPLTNISGTSLLTLQDNRFKDNSNNNFTLTAVGSPIPSIKDTNPFTPVTINPAVHGGSVLFAGNTYHTITSQPSLSFGNGDFTVDCWIYPRSNVSRYEAICSGTDLSAFSLQTQIVNDNKICITTTTAQILAGTIPLSLNQWNHVAATRSSGKLLLYVNGLSSAQKIGDTTNFTQITFIGGGTGGSNVNIIKNSYISNFRAIKGTALYTTASFTPSTSPLTNVSGTSLLLNTNNYGLKSSITETYPISSFTSFDGSNNLLTNHPQNWQILKLTNPLTANNGDVINYSLSTSNPNQLSLVASNTAADTTGINRPYYAGSPTLTSFKPYPNFNDSFRFNGSTDWISVPANINFTFNNDFTIEFWINTTIFSLDTASRRVISFGVDAANALSINFQAGTSNLGVLASTQIITGTIPVANGIWHHVAVSRYNNALRLYVDGIQSGDVVLNATNFNTGATSIMSIGSYNNGSTGRLSGAFINEFRIVNGTAVYTTSAFTPPSAAPLQYIPNTVFLLKNGGNFNQSVLTTNTYADASTATMTNTNAVLSTASPFGAFNGGSISFNGTNSYITFPTNTNLTLTNDFTIEFWANYIPVGAGRKTYVSTSWAAGGFTIWNHYSYPDRFVMHVANYNDQPTGAILASTTALQANLWYHVAVTRRGNDWKMFVNGKLESSRTAPTATITLQTLYLGAWNNGSFSDYLNGCMANVRIIKGTCLYDADFSVPTSPPLLLNGTSLLLKSPHSLTNYLLANNSPTDFHIGGALKGSTVEPRTVTADSANLNNLYIHNRGTVNFPLTSGKTLFITGPNGLQVTADGTLNIGTSSAFIPLSTTHTLVLSNTQIDVHNGGNLNVYGFPELTTTSLVSTHPIGSRTFTTTSNISSQWKVGDILSFKPNISARRSFDELILSSFLAPNVFTTTSSSLCTHTGSADQFGFIPDVYNLTRNVIIQGVNSTARGTIRTIDASKTNLNYATLSNIGGVGINSSIILANNSSGSAVLSGNVLMNDSSSYPITFSNNENIKSGAVYFDPSNYISIENSSAYAGDVTIEGWFYAFSTAGTQFLISKANTAVRWSNGNIYSITLTNGILGARIGADSPNPQIDHHTIVRPYTWNHFAVVRSAGNVQIYLNGVPSNSPPIAKPQTLTSLFDIFIGRYPGDPNLGANPFTGYMSNIRLLDGVAAYTSTFDPYNIFPLSSTPNTIYLILQDSTNTDKGPANVTLTITGNVPFVRTTPYGLIRNTTINNNIIYRPINNFGLSLNFNKDIRNTTISNNHILSGAVIGFNISNSSGSINMSNNTVVGSLSVGTNLFNTSLTGTYGALNYNSALQGMILTGVNTGTIVGGSINSAREGVYVDASTSNLSSLTFRNIVANNNSSVGFRVSGNNLNYLTPISLNVNGLTANSNLNNGFEAYNIIGNLSSLIITNNINTNIRTSIGNGPTTFNGLTSLANNSPTISSGITFLNSPTAVSSLSSPPYSGGIEGSLYFTGSAYANLPYSFNVMTDTVTLEGWIYVQTYATNWISFTTYPASNRATNYNGILGINNIGRLEFYNYQGNPALMTSTSSVQLSSWTHFAITLSAKVIKFYINGVEVSPAANTIITSTQVTTVNSMLGSQLNAETAMQFFISNYRISNNLRYNGNFSVPSFPITTVDANTLLLYKNPYNNTFLTSSVNSNNLNVNILSGYNYSKIYIKDASIGKLDTYHSVFAQLIMDSTRFSNFSLENSVVTGGGLVNPILLNATRNLIEGSYLFNNTNLGSINFIDLTKYQPSVTRTSGFGFTNHNKIAGNHFTYLPMGLKAADTSLYDTSTSDLISERLTPTSRTMKLCSGTKYVALNSGETTLVKVNILVSSSYTGNLPRLMLRRNAAAGVYSDTILSVFNPNFGYNTFAQLVGVQTPAVIDNAVLEFYVDCDGTTGYVCVDTWTAN